MFEPPSAHRRSYARRAGSALLTLVALTAGGGPRPAAAAPPAQAASGGVTYRLADTWQDRPWELTAGRYGETSDISSNPDGTTFVLDGRHQAIHVLAPDGTPERVFEMTWPAQGNWAAVRLDAGWDDTVFVLTEGGSVNGNYVARIDQLTRTGEHERPNGAVLLSVELSALTPNAYKDLAIRPDGRIYVSRAGPGNPYVTFPGPTATPMPPGTPPLNAIEVFGPDGRFQERFGSEHLCMPDSLDGDRDGTLYVVSLCPSPFGSGQPGPTPTPRPSWLAPLAAPRQSAPQQAPAATEGVLVFGPDHAFQEKVQLSNAEDIAVGPAGVFVSRNLEIFPLRDSRPLYASPVGQTYAAFFGDVVFHLDVPARGGLLASMNHCFYQGVLTFSDPGQRPAVPTLRGALDQPELEGPAYPLRVAAGDGLAVLQGSFVSTGSGPRPTYLIMPYYGEQQVVQRWRPDGTLASQLGLCTQSGTGLVRDVAADGLDVFTIDQSILQRRPDDALPAWSFWTGIADQPGVTARLAAVTADGGRVAVLDVGADRVVILDREQRELARWPLSLAGANAAPSDLALGADRVFLADGGRNRVVVRGLDGRALGEWPLYESALGLAVGPEGDVYVLGRGGWGYRYQPDGTLVTSWPMPDLTLEALDIAVGPEGQVYVPFLRRQVLGEEPVRGADYVQLAAAGIWVFAAAPAPPPPEPPAPSACVAAPDKRAWPDRLPLGDTVEVRLTVQGRCPGRSDPAQVALVFDTSRSMNFDSVIEGARDGALALLDALDPQSAEVALVTFDDAAALKQPLTRDFGAIRTRVAALEAWGDTRMATGLESALAELTGPRLDPAARQVAVVVTDGLPKDDPFPAAEALRSAGIEVFVLVFPSWEFMEPDQDDMLRLAGNSDRLWVAPLPADYGTIAHDLSHYRGEPGLFQTLTITDVIPGNMRYVPGSARPPAELRGDRLVWTFAGVPAANAVGLAYTLQPLAVGTWPTNIEATGAYRDALGNDGALVFPIPQVTVFDFDRHHRIYLPYLSKGQCLRPERPLDVVLALDTSSSMLDQDPGGGSKLDAAVAAAGSFLDLLRLPRDHAAVVTFNRSAERRADLTGDRARLHAALTGLPTAQGTRIDLGLSTAGEVLAAGARPAARQVVVLLTDGIPTIGSPADVLAAADALKAGGVLVYTIGLGGDVQPDLLRAVATSPDRYFPSPSAADLAEIYAQISERLACEGDGVDAARTGRGPWPGRYPEGDKGSR